MRPPDRMRPYEADCEGEWCDFIYQHYGDEETEQALPARVEITHAEVDDKTIDLGIYLDTPIVFIASKDGDDTGETFHVRLNLTQARSLAYALLWHANDLADPDGWKGKGE